MPSFLGRIFNKKKKANPTASNGAIAKQITEEELFGDFTHHPRDRSESSHSSSIAAPLSTSRTHDKKAEAATPEKQATGSERAAEKKGLYVLIVEDVQFDCTPQVADGQFVWFVKNARGCAKFFSPPFNLPRPETSRLPKSDPAYTPLNFVSFFAGIQQAGDYQLSLWFCDGNSSNKAPLAKLDLATTDGRTFPQVGGPSDVADSSKGWKR